MGERLIVPFYDPITHSEPHQPSIDFSIFDAVLVDTRWPGAAAIALTEARRLGIPAILDADIAPKSILERLLPLASHIVASLPASHLVFEQQIDAREATQRLCEAYGVFAAVTDGSKGTYFSAPSGPVHHIQAYKVDAVDTLAAGDVFHGAFAARFAETGNEADAIALASAAAAIKCLYFGGRLGAPTRNETLKFMEERAL
jgi:sulfofructose kinase